MDVLRYNRTAWDRYVETGNPWTKPVGPEAVAAARAGDWSIVLTPTRPVPREWFPPLQGRRVLCLASGGGQQGPILAAAGAEVVVVDNSPRQLAGDRLVASREGLRLGLVQGDMRELGMFRDGTFDLIVHPISNPFIPDPRPVWREAFRVLRPGGWLLAGVMNPSVYIFDYQQLQQGHFQVRYRLPYSDLRDLDPVVREQLQAQSEAMEFGHTLEDQLGGQLDAGFLLAGLYEDRDPSDPLAAFMATTIATRALKPLAQGEARGAGREHEAIEARLRDGTRVVLRPIVPADRAALVEAFSRLSPETRRRRFLTDVSRLTDDRLRELTQVDQRDHIAWCGFSGATGRLLGVGRCVRLQDSPAEAEVALVVEDTHQGLGLGTLLFAALTWRAVDQGVRRFVAFVLQENRPVTEMLMGVGASVRRMSSGVLELALELPGEPSELPDTPAGEVMRAVAAELRRDRTAARTAPVELKNHLDLT